VSRASHSTASPARRRRERPAVDGTAVSMGRASRWFVLTPAAAPRARRRVTVSEDGNCLQGRGVSKTIAGPDPRTPMRRSWVPRTSSSAGSGSRSTRLNCP